MVGADVGGGLTLGPADLPDTGPDDKNGLVAGEGAAAKGLPAGLPGTFGRPGKFGCPGFPVDI